MIAKDLPFEIAWAEFRLNVDNQYNSFIAWYLTEGVLWLMQIEYANDVLKAWGLIKNE